MTGGREVMKLGFSPSVTLYSCKVGKRGHPETMYIVRVLSGEGDNHASGAENDVHGILLRMTFCVQSKINVPIVTCQSEQLACTNYRPDFDNRRLGANNML